MAVGLEKRSKAVLLLVIIFLYCLLLGFLYRQDILNLPSCWLPVASI